MSALPPDIVSSVLQGALQHRQAGVNRAVGDRRQAEDNLAIARAAEQRENQVENTDADSRVHPDGGGTGSQGRPFSEPEANAAESEDHASAEGLTTDESGRPHLDIIA